MSFLTDDAKSALEQRFQELRVEETQPVQSEPKVEPRAEEMKVQNATDVKKVEASSTADKEESEYQVPYKRFKEVNESKKAFKAKADELERQLAEARAQLSKGREAPRQQKEVLDTPFNEYDEFYNSVMQDEPSDDRVSSLEKRLQSYEMKAAQAELEMELAGISRKYPEVPQQVLLQACMTDPEKNLEDVAKEYSQFIAEIEERALAKHAKKLAPAAPPRPNSVGSLAPTNNSKPRTMADARAAALAFMKQQQGF